jgi:hypothetical protein
MKQSYYFLEECSMDGDMQIKDEDTCVYLLPNRQSNVGVGDVIALKFRRVENAQENFFLALLNGY